MITLEHLTKRFGAATAVDDLDLRITPGRVTGFLGPNGAGKSTTMRMVLGLDHPTAGSALVNGRPYAELRHPLREVGALLEAGAIHPGRSARNHLQAMARADGIRLSRVEEVIDQVGLGTVAKRRAGSFSLGMRQRLGIAAALLGDPGVLMFDEPVNGLDPDGVRWIRELMRSLAAEGRTVFVSSHLMSEMQQTADHLVVIGRGRLIADAPTDELIAGGSLHTVQIRTPDAERLRAGLPTRGVSVEEQTAGVLAVTGLEAAAVGDLAHALGARIHELRTRETSLEQAYMRLTATSVEFGARDGAVPDGAGPDDTGHEAGHPHTTTDQTMTSRKVHS